MSNTDNINRVSKDESDIRAVIDGVHSAHHRKDAAGIVAPYASDAVISNLAPPLSTRGEDVEKMQAWLDTWDGPIGLESRDLEVTVSGDYAFGYGFYRMSGTQKPLVGQSAFGCARPCVCTDMVQRGKSSTNIHPCRSIWMAVCERRLILSPNKQSGPFRQSNANGESRCQHGKR